MSVSPDDGEQEAVIAFLNRPETYGVKAPVERIDTHAAIIFLAGARAYKLKRAVHYSYLDFSTVAKRKAVCEKELALNRRTAPELYLEVRSVNRLADGSLGFGDGEPVDWLIVMRRFDADSLLEVVTSRGGLNAALVRELADEIASFHDHAEIVQCDDGAERVRQVINGGVTTACERLRRSSHSQHRRMVAARAAARPPRRKRSRKSLPRRSPSRQYLPVAGEANTFRLLGIR
jgi:aminoglycoside phosphotransferase family enzyme